MEAIQVVLDKKLLLVTDRAARRAKRNRSALLRDALREHLRRLDVRDKERRDRLGYSARPEAERIERMGSGGCVAGRIARGNMRLAYSKVVSQ